MLAALLPLLAAIAAAGRARSPDACRKATEAVEASASEDEGRAQAAYAQCRRMRPEEGLLGVREASQDCREFSQAYWLARHYKGQSFSAAEFCSALKLYSDDGKRVRDRKLNDHETCMARMTEALGAKEVREAVEKACAKVNLHVDVSTEYCQRFVTALGNASRDGTLNMRHLCDKLLTGGNGTQGFSQEHFVYSCVQYADNLKLQMGEAPEGRTSALARKVHDNCEKHLSSHKGHFCQGFADLVQRHAAHSEFVRFCGMQYELMHSREVQRHSVKLQNASSQSSAAPSSQISAGLSKESGSTGAAGASATAADKHLCEAHLHSIEELHLERTEAANIVRMDCPKRFEASQSVCTQMGQLFAAGRVREACHLAVRARSAAVNMTAICERAATKVESVGLEGEALRQAAGDVCAKEVEAVAPWAAKVQTHAGCRFFAVHLDQAQQSGDLDVPRFCASLVTPGMPAQPLAAATTALPPPNAPPAQPLAAMGAVVAASAETAASPLGVVAAAAAGSAAGTTGGTETAAVPSTGTMGITAAADSAAAAAAAQQPTVLPASPSAVAAASDAGTATGATTAETEAAASPPTAAVGLAAAAALRPTAAPASPSAIAAVSSAGPAAGAAAAGTALPPAGAAVQAHADVKMPRPLAVKTRLQPRATATKPATKAMSVLQTMPSTSHARGPASQLQLRGVATSADAQDFLNGFLDRYDEPTPADPADHLASKSAPAAPRKHVRGGREPESDAATEAQVASLSNAFLGFTAPTVPPASSLQAEEKTTPRPTAKEPHADDAGWSGDEGDNEVDSVVASFLAKGQ